MKPGAQTRSFACVIGSHGLLGGHLSAALRAQGTQVLAVPPIPWKSGDSAAILSQFAHDFIRRTQGRDWGFYWCAGAGFMGAHESLFRSEMNALVAALESLSDASSDPHAGSVFLSSSVGGVYAGGKRPPFDEMTPTAATSAYGHFKAEAERTVSAWAKSSGMSVMIGRIANLYGPGQNLEKPQGLISQLCVAHLRRQPIRLWVDLDTRRDYLYVKDCASLIVACMERLNGDKRLGTTPKTVIKILASGQTRTVGAVLGESRRVFGRRPPVLVARSPATALQARDLGVRSIVWPDLDQRTQTPMSVGIARTLAELRQRHQRGEL